MLRRTLAALILVAATALAAQPVQTPEVVVTGQSELRDTLRTQQKNDLEAYWRTASPERFAYRYHPPFELSAFDEGAVARDGLMALDIALPTQARLKLGYADHANPLVNFWCEAGYAQPDDDWETNDIRLRWAGDTRNGEYTAAGGWTGHTTPLADATISWSELAAKGEWSLPFSLVQSLRVSLRGIAMSEETRAANRDLNEMDAIIESGLAWNGWRGDIDVAHLQSSTTGQLTFWRHDIPFLDTAGVWLAGDSEHLYGSIAFQRRFTLGGAYPWIAALNIYNDPGMGRVSRAHELAAMPTRHIDSCKLQEKRPLDLHAVFEYNTFLPLSLGYRLVWLQDSPVLFRSADSLYVLGADDVWMQEATFAASYSYAWMRFDNTFTWRQADLEHLDHLPWTPETEDRFAIHADLERWGAGLSVHWLGGRRNDLDLAMDDITLLDLNVYYSLYDNLRLRAAITNLLDEPDHRYELLPDEGAGFHAGFDYHF